jgi:hypothetical protein
VSETVNAALVEPLFSCSDENCRVEVSWPAYHLAMTPDGRQICESCWDEEAFANGEDAPQWGDLPPFVPPYQVTIDALRDENTRLRAALANSDQPCVYCSLSAEDMSKCASGFPGCARADDAVGCPHLGAGLGNDALRAERDELHHQLATAKARGDADCVYCRFRRRPRSMGSTGEQR